MANTAHRIVNSKVIDEEIYSVDKTNNVGICIPKSGIEMFDTFSIRRPPNENTTVEVNPLTPSKADPFAYIFFNLSSSL